MQAIDRKALYLVYSNKTKPIKINTTPTQNLSSHYPELALIKAQPKVLNINK
jgi:hypothetical protein